LAGLVLMSIKPKYGEEVLSGVKKLELRRRVAPLHQGDRVVLYFSSPVKAICGEFTAGRIYVGGLEELRRVVAEYPSPGVFEEDWEYVIGGSRPAMAVEVLRPKRYPKPISLSELRRLIAGFRPPMSYRRVKVDEPLYQVLSSLDM